MANLTARLAVGCPRARATSPYVVVEPAGMALSSPHSLLERCAERGHHHGGQRIELAGEVRAQRAFARCGRGTARQLGHIPAHLTPQQTSQPWRVVLEVEGAQLSRAVRDQEQGPERRWNMSERQLA